VQLLEVEFVAVLDALSKSSEPVREVMSWADKCCERLMGNHRQGGQDERGTMSSRSVLIRWGYVTSQVMRDFVRPLSHHHRTWWADRQNRQSEVIQPLALSKF
jgi:hypothetical protein